MTSVVAAFLRVRFRPPLFRRVSLSFGAIGVIVMLCFFVLCGGRKAIPQEAPNVRLARLAIGDVDPSSSSADLQKRFDLYKSMGIGTLRIGVTWRDMETSPGAWQVSPGVLNFLTVAQHNGFRLNGAIGAMLGPPLWFFRAHSDAQMVNEDGLKSFNVLSYWYPGLHDLLEEKDDQVFTFLSREGLLPAVDYVVIPFGPAGEPLYPPAWTTSARQGRSLLVL
jgi:hypothetical protein